MNNADYNRKVADKAFDVIRNTINESIENEKKMEFASVEETADIIENFVLALMSTYSKTSNSFDLSKLPEDMIEKLGNPYISAYITSKGEGSSCIAYGYIDNKRRICPDFINPDCAEYNNINTLLEENGIKLSTELDYESRRIFIKFSVEYLFKMVDMYMDSVEKDLNGSKKKNL